MRMWENLKAFMICCWDDCCCFLLFFVPLKLLYHCRKLSVTSKIINDVKRRVRNTHSMLFVQDQIVTFSQYAVSFTLFRYKTVQCRRRRCETVSYYSLSSFSFMHMQAQLVTLCRLSVVATTDLMYSNIQSIRSHIVCLHERARKRSREKNRRIE